jgi:hypothetical protein
VFGAGVYTEHTLHLRTYLAYYLVPAHTLQKANMTSLLRWHIFGIVLNPGGNKEDRHGIPF